MRIDGVGYKKNALSNIVGFLSEENGVISFTKSKGTYQAADVGGLKTRQQIATQRAANTVANKLVGALQLEKELFRFNKSDITNVENTPVAPTEYGGTTYYTRLVKVNTTSGSYPLQFGTTELEVLKNFDDLFGINA